MGLKNLILVQEREIPQNHLTLMPILSIRVESLEEVESKMKEAGIPARVDGDRVIFRFKDLYHSEEWHLISVVEPGVIALAKEIHSVDHLVITGSGAVIVKFIRGEEGHETLGTYRLHQVPTIE